MYRNSIISHVRDYVFRSPLENQASEAFQVCCNVASVFPLTNNALLRHNIILQLWIQIIRDYICYFVIFYELVTLKENNRDMSYWKRNSRTIHKKCMS